MSCDGLLQSALMAQRAAHVGATTGGCKAVTITATITAT
jgi:hypothetical protein